MQSRPIVVYRKGFLLDFEVVRIVYQKSADSAKDLTAADQNWLRESVKDLDDKSVADLLTKELDIAGYRRGYGK